MPIGPSSGPIAPEVRPDVDPRFTGPQGRPAGTAESSAPHARGHDLQPLAARRRDAGHAGAEASMPRPPSPMKRHRVELAGYLLARTAPGQPITDPDTLRMLKDGADSMQVTRQRLRHSNVVPVVRETRHESYIRGAVGQAIGLAVEGALGPKDRANQTTATIAAIGEMLGAGACDTYASTVVHEHAPKLQAGERIERVDARDFHASNVHSWAQLHAAGKPVIVLDPWGHGPAMLAEDTTLVAQYVQGHVDSPEKAAHDLAQARARVHTPAYHQYAVDNVRAALDRGEVPPADKLFAPTPFVDPALPDRAARALGKLPEQDQQRLAMHVAQEQLGTSREAASLAAPDIVAAAKNLHRL